MNKRQKRNLLKTIVTSAIPALVVAGAGNPTAVRADEVQSVAANAIASASTQPPAPPALPQGIMVTFGTRL